MSDLSLYIDTSFDYLKTGDFAVMENLFGKKKKAGEKNALQKLGDKIRNAAKKVGEFAILVPFKKPMENALKSKGVTTNGQIEDIAAKFYETFITKTKNYENQHLDPVLIPTIISAIIAFFKNLKAKRDAGQTLTQMESNILEGAEEVVSGVKGAAKSEAKFAIGDFLTKYWWLIALLVYLLFFR